MAPGGFRLRLGVPGGDLASDADNTLRPLWGIALRSTLQRRLYLNTLWETSAGCVPSLPPSRHRDGPSAGLVIFRQPCSTLTLIYSPSNEWVLCAAGIGVQDR